MSRKNAKLTLLIASLLICFGVMAFMTRIIPLSPDEYFYSSSALAISKAFHFIISINSINTEHSPLFVLVAGFFVSIFKTNNIYILRLLVASISIATLYLYLKIFREKLDKKEAYWPLLFLLLIPGYFYASSKFILEIPTAFATALFALLLIRKKRSYLIGLSLVLVLLLKEYYFFLLAPIAVAVSVCDRLFSKNTFWGKILLCIFDIILILLPAILVSLLLIDFNIGPYSRMLENSWKELMQSSFAFLNKKLFFVVEPIARMLGFLNQKLLLLADHFRGITAPQGTDTIELAKTASQIKSLSIGTDFISKAVVDSPIAVSSVSQLHPDFFQKLWLIYKYNFSDLEFITVGFILAVFGGIKVFCVVARNFIKKYSDTRFDFIMVLFGLVFLFFNYQQAVNEHGFRLNVPITFVLGYFIYLGFKTIRDTKNIYARTLFIAITILSLGAYLRSEGEFVFGSVLSKNSVVMTILSLKRYIYSSGYLLFVIYLSFYSSLRTKYKQLIVAAIVVAFFMIKILPFAIEKNAELSRDGEDYMLSKSSVVLNSILTDQKEVITNINCYKVYYYASWYKTPNDDIHPDFRVLPEKFPILCNRFASSDEAIGRNGSKESFYILSVRENDVEDKDLKVFLDQNSTRITLVKQQSNTNNQVLWSVWKYTN